MMKKSIIDALNEQVQKEGYSSNLYLAMASWAETKGYDGITQWLYAQADEEKMHMLKIIGFVNERGGKAIIPAFEQPPAEWKSIREMFDQVLEHEQYVTESIHSIIPIIEKGKDYAALNWIQWFVDEQMEEESSVQAIIDKLNLMGDKNIYMFDRDIMAMRAEGSEEA
ncbi:MAG: ferritin [Candidatus Delongbacteria bacterium]|jgi:ferritin|nr:ferritin [Candidatus Delongbacteria bacterium]